MSCVEEIGRCYCDCHWDENIHHMMACCHRCLCCHEDRITPIAYGQGDMCRKCEAKWEWVWLHNPIEEDDEVMIGGFWVSARELRDRGGENFVGKTPSKAYIIGARRRKVTPP